MKISRFLMAASVTLVLAGCTGGGKKPASDGMYVLCGNATGVPDSTVVTLGCYSDGVYTAVDSTYIIGGRYRMTGKADTVPYRSFIQYEDLDFTRMAYVFLEEGRIDVAPDGRNLMVTGTPSNDASDKFYRALYRHISSRDSMERDMYKLQKAGIEKICDEEHRVYDAANDKFDGFATRYISKNISSPAGAYLFLEFYYKFDPVTARKLMNRIPDNIASLPEFVETEEQVDDMVAARKDEID